MVVFSISLTCFIIAIASCGGGIIYMLVDAAIEKMRDDKKNAEKTGLA